MEVNFFVLFLLFIIYSFIGWIMEVICIYYETGKLINRGFLVGPYCPIYGFGAIIIMLSLNKYTEDLVILFFMSIIVCSLLEYSTSYVMEKMFNTRWWDYSKKKFNINGRICLETMIPFGILGCLMMYYINPFIVNHLLMMRPVLLDTIAIVLMFIFVTDCALSLKIIFNLKNLAINLHTDSTEKITKLVKKEIEKKKKYFHKRLIKAFPKMTMHKKDE